MTDKVENSKVAELKPKRTSYEEIVDAWNRRPISNRVGSRRYRRRLVVATYGGWLLITAMVKLWTLSFAGWEVPVFVLLIAYSIISFVWRRRTYINTPELKDVELDERLVQIRNQAFRTAFRVFAPSVLIAWLLSLFLMTLQPGQQGLANAVLIFYGAAMLSITLPTAIVAWREPDPTEPEPLSA